MVGTRSIGAGYIGIIALFFSVPLLADVKAGVEAWTRGDFPAAVSEWIEPAAKGDADAQFNLGQAYKLGRGVKQDLAKAEELFAKAAAQGHIHASDNYGLLLFQRGERGKALPYISAAADRGDPRAQYLMGIALFNGDNVPKNWERAYALVSLAHRAGLSQATAALSQMDQYIPVEQRQRSVTLAAELSAQADATRARQIAAADLGNSVANNQPGPLVTAAPRPPLPPVMVPTPAKGPSDAGADYARPQRPAVAAVSTSRTPLEQSLRPVPPKPAAVSAVPPTKPAVTAVASGNWRIQLGAFGVAKNADVMWERVRGRPELSGHARMLVPAGAVTKLQAGGFASEATARSACANLAAAGFACLAVNN